MTLRSLGTPTQWALDWLAAFLSIAALAWVFFWLPLMIDTADSNQHHSQHIINQQEKP